MDDVRSLRVFSWIAPVYGLFYQRQKRHYESVLDAVLPQIDLSPYRSVLDVGCGTGALCAVLSQRGHTVTGIDPVRKMLAIAASHTLENPVGLVRASVLERLPFDDKSFDVVIASYVAHGLKEDDRKVMYAEMDRIARYLVVFHDYNHRRAIITDLVEWFEGGDYFNFVKKARPEMKAHFRDVRVIDVSKRAAWYICVPNE